MNQDNIDRNGIDAQAANNTTTTTTTTGRTYIKVTNAQR